MAEAVDLQRRTPQTTAQLTAPHGRAGMEAFFRVIKLWNVKNHDALILLGQPAQRTFFNWKKGQVARVPQDTMRRISYVLGIYKALQILFAQPAMADDWVTRPNQFFGGQSPLKRMLGGDVSDLYVVRQYLDAARGGWS